MTDETESIRITKKEYEELKESLTKINLIDGIIHNKMTDEEIEKNLEEGYKEMAPEVLKVAEEWEHTEKDLEKDIGD